MRCPSCDTVSLSSCCPVCGTCEGQFAGFSPFDLLDPIGLGKSMGDSGINPLNPIGTGETLGSGGTLGIGSAAKGAAASVVSLASTLKWLAIGGAVVVGGVLIYSAVKFIPKMAEAAAANVKEGAKFGGRIAEKAL